MPTREVIKPQVIGALTDVSKKPAAAINEPDKLDQDLNMTEVKRRSMALPYSTISAKYQGNAIKQGEAGGLTTVAESIDLVTKRANRK